MFSFVDLPEDILLYMCKYYLYPRHVSNLVRTCKRLHGLLNSKLWKTTTDSDAAKRELLHKSAQVGHLATIQKLVNEFKLELSNSAGHEALRLAVQKGHVSVVAYLFAKGAEYSRESEKTIFSYSTEQSALEMAAEGGNLDIVCLLLRHGATLGDRVEALKQSVLKGNEMVVRELLNKSDPNLPASHVPLLQLAVSTKVESIMLLLLDRGADVDMYHPEANGTPLKKAVQADWLWAVQTLLSRGASANARDWQGCTALHAAMGSREPHERFEMVRLLLEYGGDPECKDNAQVTPLSLAIAYQHLDIVHFILAHGYTLNTGTIKNTDRLLCTAAQKGDKVLAKEAVRLGADVNKSEGVGVNTWPPLHHAAYEGQLEVMEFLVSSGAILDPGSSLPTPLHLALGRGHLAAAQWLLVKGADLYRTANRLHPWSSTDSTFRPRWTSLHFAALGGMEVFRLVLDHGYTLPLGNGNPMVVSLWESAIRGRDSTNQEFLQLVLNSIRDENGDYVDAVDPITHLFKLGHSLNESIVKAILADGDIDLSQANENGKTLLHISAMVHDHQDVIKVLLAQGIPVNARDSNGRTALFYAAENQNPEAVRMLLEYGATPHSNNLKNHPLWACLFGEGSFVSCAWAPTEELIALMCATIKELFEYGAGTSEILQQRTILHELFSNRNYESLEIVVQMLLDLGVDPNRVDEAGMTPLHYSALFGYTQTVTCLLLGGADVNIKNRQGKTAVQIAEDNGWSVVVDLILRKAAGLSISIDEIDALHERLTFRFEDRPWEHNGSI
ncbi:ankyrin repeat-containing domain protein [Aspergillus lucknowensis]|uniref:Ankyrin repeat-containing domain protein n=1 Tax=Aspergillus lucknowensis TaxID=176173 RepID=A0ABR4LKR9_9EURO